MASIINSTDTGSGGLITTGDSSDELQLQTAEVARVTLTNTAVVVNESGANVDFRVEGDTDANLLFVDASTDRVGIGTSSPVAALNVIASVDKVAVIGAASNLDSDSDVLWGAGIKETQLLNGTASRPGILAIGGSLTSDESLGIINFFRSGNTDGFRSRAYVRGATTATGTANQHGGILMFATAADDAGNPTERMRITSAGNVGIGTSLPGQKLEVSGGAAQFNGGGIDGNFGDAILFGNTSFPNVQKNRIRSSISSIVANNKLSIETGTTTGNFNNNQLVLEGTGTIVFGTYGAGTLSTSASGVISASDGRYKTKTREVTSGLEAIAALQPTYFRWNEDSPFASEYEELGFVAQEVAAVIPEASPGEDEEGKYRNYHDRAIIAMLVKGMQEQQALITALTARVAALESN